MHGGATFTHTAVGHVQTHTASAPVGMMAEKTKHSKASLHFVKIVADNVHHKCNNLFACESINTSNLSEYLAKLGLA